eukprot:88963_1
MTTFGNPYDNQYHASSAQSGKSKRAAAQNQKEARKQKKSKSKGGGVNKGSKHGGYKDKKGGGRGGGGGGGFWGGGGGTRQRDDGGGGGADVAPGLLGFVQVICCAAAIGQLVVGIIHTINLLELLEDICDDDVTFYDCVGESLFWNVEDVNGDETCNGGLTIVSGITSFGGSAVPWDRTACNEDIAGHSSWLNSAWRARVFSLVPDVFMDNWTPLIFGLIAVAQCIAGMQSDWISGSLLKALLFHIVMMLFACFGYAGQAGIVIGFIQAFAGFLILVAMIMSLGGYAYPTFNLGCC